jgi:hypothetical protein
MKGASVTSGLSANSGRIVASGTTIGSWVWIVCVQKDSSRAVSQTSIPWRYLAIGDLC